jgi:hypothetical protein
LSSDKNLLNILPDIEDSFFKNYLIFDNYVNIKQQSFISFFIKNFIDVPICFKKSKSLKTKSFELFFLKFNNLLMREGKREKTCRILLHSIFLFYDEWIKKNSFQFSLIDFFYFLNSNITTISDKLHYVEKNENISNFYDDVYSLYYKDPNIDYFIKNFLKTKLFQLSPVFFYFIYSVDKNIRKFTRGKSGKYVFI